MKKLGQQTGGDNKSRHAEGLRLMEIINTGEDRNLTDWERSFVEGMEIRFEVNPGFVPSGKQIFKLRDIRDKTL